MGDDDIFWVNQLQVALMKAGCYPADEEVEDFIFADGTHSALLTFQALNGLDEMGIADMPTWAALLGPELRPASGSPATGTSDEAPAAALEAAQPTMPQQPAAAPAWDSLFAADANGAQESASNGSAGGPGAAAATAGQPAGHVAPPYRPAPSAAPPPSRWPVVRMDDGGREVHWLQCALERAGCYCGEDEMMWWQFGMATESALRTFQGINGLPETGVSDAGTWQALLGEAAQPADLVNLSANNAQYDDDMSGHSDSVWLLGEQRWSRPVS
jgi:peptidoglycan hydrolase-like protein with peptidoglycan-binding domain